MRLSVQLRGPEGDGRPPLELRPAAVREPPWA